MRILAADTATPANTVALWEDGSVVVETAAQCGRKHAERLMGTIDWVLSEAGLSVDGVDYLAISIGPGSFTGLRIGLATMKGLALAAGKGLVGVPTLDAMTRLAPFHDECVVPLLDARMQEVFGAVFRFDGSKRCKLRGDSVCPATDLLSAIPGGLQRPPFFMGDGAVLYAEALRGCLPQARIAPLSWAMPRASAVAAEAAEMLEWGVSADPAGVAPVYLRKSQAEEARNAARCASG